MLPKPNVLHSAVQNARKRTSRRRNRAACTTSSVAQLLAASTFAHMATLPSPAASTSLPTVSVPRQELGNVSVENDRILERRQELGRAAMQRDRILQQAKTHPEMWARNKLLLKRKQQRIVTMRKDSGPPPTINDVYNLLNSKTFEDCPWPIPPSAILMFLPIAEIPGVKNSEAILRKMVGDDKVLKYNSCWKFENGPRPHFT